MRKPLNKLLVSYVPVRYLMRKLSNKLYWYLQQQSVPGVR